MEEREVSLGTIGRGAAAELFEHELERVLENIADRNTKAEAKRSITLEVTLEPNTERDEVGITINVKSKLAPFKGHSGTVFVGRKQGRMVAVETDPKQYQMKWDEESRPRAIDDERADA